MVFAEKLNFESSIERKLTLQNVVILSLSAMVGSGLFVLPALAGKELYYGSGNMSGIYAAAWLAYLVSALVVLPGALSKSELSTAMPLSGGAYLYIERTFGPLLGTMAGLGLWSSFFLKSAFALVGFSAYLIATEGLLGWEISTLTSKLVATGLLVVITGINIRGLGLLKKVQTPILFIAVGCVLLLVGWAFLNGTVDRPTAPIDAAGEAVTSLSGWQGIAASAAYVFFAYAGITKVAAVAGEIKDPSRNVPLGILLSLVIAGGLYSLVAFALFGSMEASAFGIGVEAATVSTAPVHLFAVEVGGETIAFGIAVLAILTMSGGALTGLLAASRFPFAMGRDKLLPASLENVHPRFETPHVSVVLTGLAMGASIWLLDVNAVSKLASGFLMMVFIAVNICVIVLRRVEDIHDWYRPAYTSPLFPWMQVFGIITAGILLILSGMNAVLGAFGAMVIGWATFHFYGRHHTTIMETPWDSLRRILSADESEILRWTTAFHAADIEDNLTLNLSEFESALRALKIDLDEDGIRDLFHVSDGNQDGVLDIAEFFSMLQSKLEEE